MLTSQQLKMLRIRKMLTQQELANVLGISREFIAMVENGSREFSEERYQEYINAIYRVESMTPTQRKANKKKHQKQNNTQED